MIHFLEEKFEELPIYEMREISLPLLQEEYKDTKKKKEYKDTSLKTDVLEIKSKQVSSFCPHLKKIQTKFFFWHLKSWIDRR